MEIIDTVQSNREKYLKFNEIKYKRFQDLITNVNIRRIVNSIPYLLCVNHKKIPGYVEGEAPLGIACYVPDDDTKKFIKGKFPATRIEFYEGPPFVQMLAIMGSVGTIAYNKKSDFDYWVCIDSRGVKSELLENFKKKIDIIQKWASAEINLSVHLFINDIEMVKKNIFAEDEDEAFGATIGAILKDEFLRSSIIICGKIPFWWVVPEQVSDDEYNIIKARVPEDVFNEQFIDLGNLREISQEDFLGAALFQIIKSLGNPFKSIIKMGVLEKYLTVSNDSPLLSQKVKANVIRENLDNTTLDGYLMMFKEV
ncbi:MAG: class I adenylate cyclase, partial [Spirochaetes bacterium]|nr:class I adenylate cyclase [Spirochaetota bacterium]